MMCFVVQCAILELRSKNVRVARTVYSSRIVITVLFVCQHEFEA